MTASRMALDTIVIVKQMFLHPDFPFVPRGTLVSPPYPFFFLVFFPPNTAPKPSPCLEARVKAAQACTLNAPVSHSRLREEKTTRLYKQEAIQVSILL